MEENIEVLNNEVADTSNIVSAIDINDSGRVFLQELFGNNILETVDTPSSQAHQEDIEEALNDENEEEEEWEEEEEDNSFNYELLELEADEEDYDEEHQINNEDNDILEEENILDIIEREEQERLASQKNFKLELSKEEIIIIDDTKVVENIVLASSFTKNVILSKYCTISATIEAFDSGYQIRINNAFKSIAKFEFNETTNKFLGKDYIPTYLKEKDVNLLERILNLYIDNTFGKLLGLIELMGLEEGIDYTIETPTNEQSFYLNRVNSSNNFPKTTNEYEHVPIFIFQLRFKDIVITNKYKATHVINDIIYQLVFLSKGTVMLRGTNPAMTNTELSCGFTGHPHFQTKHGFTHVCLGNGSIGGHISTLGSALRLVTSLPIEGIFNQLIAAIMSAAKYEDLDGGPYFRLESIVYRGNNNNNSYNFTGLSRDSNFLIQLLNSYPNFKIPIKVIQSIDKSFIYTIDKAKLYYELDNIVNLYQDDFNDIHKAVLNDKGLPTNTVTTKQTFITPYDYHVPYVWEGEVYKKIINVSKLEPDKKEIIKLGMPVYFKEFIYHKLINDLFSPKFVEYANKKTNEK